jgi:hypothetical protein
VDWVDETLHPADIQGPPRMNLWLTFSVHSEVF